LFREWRTLEPFSILLDQRYVENDLRHLATSGFPLAVFQVDLDNFKNVNEQLGHVEGDEAIKLAERTLYSAIAGRGESYRRGGDELFAFMVGVSEAEATDFAARLRMDVESKFHEWAESRSLAAAPTASIGAVYIARACAPDELARELDAAQREAKRAGKNRVVFASVEKKIYC